jgi:DNA sulfur modification protein DndD
MILEKLYMEDFRVFAGKQEVELTPVNKQRRVVLIGGMNGCGKTSFLDAIQLALHGPRAFLSSKGEFSYETYLRDSINREANPVDGASVGLEFKIRQDGKDQRFRIQRYWNLQGQSIREKLHVYLNGELDGYMTDNWGEVVETHFPQAISQLFFFDGEKIKDLAEPNTSKQILKTAIWSLLGLGVMQRLQQDLVAMERKYRSQKRSSDFESSLEKLAEDRDRWAAKAKELEQELLPSSLTKIDLLDKQLSSAKEKFREEGGELFQQRESLKNELAQAQARLYALKQRARVWADTWSPFLLVGGLVDRALEMVESENSGRQALEIKKVLKAKSKALSMELEKHRVAKQVIERVLSIMLPESSKIGERSTKLHLSAEGKTSLVRIHDLLSSKDVWKEVREFSSEKEKIEGSIVVLERKISSVPEEDSIKSIAEDLIRLENEKLQLQRQFERLEEELRSVRFNYEKAEANYLAVEIESFQEKLASEETLRILRHSEKTRATVKKLEEVLLKKNLARIEDEITRCYKILMRKDGFVGKVKVDPIEYCVQVFDEKKREILTKDLSSGERQLLATATLWALANCAGRKLPTIVDTPLGRLDSAHRGRLVSDYFPKAGEQVLLLSTDEEIDQALQKQLEPFLSHSYLLRYNDQTSRTSVETGYFW